ncbi:MAG: hypothetical protein KJO82_02695 [Gammaproteobacteria bacterium]|nr:hypothetical protein [Gammaproteobacteria bacterium]
MQLQIQDTYETDPAAIGRYYDGQLRVIARQAVTVWFNRDRLDRLLASYIGVLDDCGLLYAIGPDGRQVSSNIQPSGIDVGAYGQDLSARPYSVSLEVLKSPVGHGAFACRSYVSQITQQPCVTVMYGVSAGDSLLGFVAADISQA